MSKAQEQELVSFMDRGVLRMPYELAMSNELSRLQFYERVQSLLDRIESPSSEQQAAQQDERNDALQDSAYAAGMLSGWNLCVADDHATFSRIRGERMTGAARVSLAARASNGGKA